MNFVPQFIDRDPQSGSWVEQIEDDIMNFNYVRDNATWNQRPDTWRSQQQETAARESLTAYYKDICRPFEEDPGLIFGTVQCLWTKNIISALGHCLSHKNVDTICRMVFSVNGLTDTMIEHFFEALFPCYLQREYSWICLDLLTRAYTFRPKLFLQMFAKCLIKSVKIPKGVLLDFFVNLNEEQRNDFMKVLINVNLSLEEFVYHLQTINFLFLNSAKTSSMCLYVAEILEMYAHYCYTNRDFGRLLLSLTENMSDSDVDHKTVKELIDCHKSEFWGLCNSAFNEIIGEMHEQQREELPPRFIIPCLFEYRRGWIKYDNNMM